MVLIIHAEILDSIYLLYFFTRSILLLNKSLGRQYL